MSLGPILSLISPQHHYTRLLMQIVAGDGVGCG
jgi:hypothetical protein